MILIDGLRLFMNALTIHKMNIYCKPTSAARGITLIEIMVVIVIVGFLARVALPSFKSTMDANRRTLYANQLVEDLALARSEAIKRGTRVVVCPSSSFTTCTTTNNWASGWIVFVDSNNDATVNTGETILRTHEALSLPTGWVAKDNLSSYVSYHPLGFAQTTGGAFQALTICLMPATGTCQAAQPTSATYTDVVISSVGRARIDSKS